MIYLELFLTFLQVGAFSFGGGYGMISLIREKVLIHGWLTEEELLNMIAVAESTPGPIAINSATFVGYKAAGVLGSVCATLGVVLPSFVIILLLSYVLQEFREFKPVVYAFNGIRAGVLALLVKALWTMYKKSPKGWPAYVVMAGAFILTAIFDFNVIFVIIGCAVFGLVTSFIMERRAK